MDCVDFLLDQGIISSSAVIEAVSDLIPTDEERETLQVVTGPFQHPDALQLPNTVQHFQAHHLGQQMTPPSSPSAGINPALVMRQSQVR